MILQALVTKVTFESKLQACKLGVFLHWYANQATAFKFDCTVHIHANLIQGPSQM